MRFALVVSGGLAALTLNSTPARAWQIESIATAGCHERITSNAVHDIGYPDGATSPAPNEEERRVIEDVPFSFPRDSQRDSWGLALFVGVRNNDVGDVDPLDVAGLPAIHNDPTKQDDHCLRDADDDGPEGDAAAIAECKAFIMNELELALGSGDAIDFGALESVPTYLKFRRKTTLHLNRMAFHMGRALHSLEDGYTHILRNDSTDQVRHVLNWIEGNLSGTGYQEDRDGHPHIGPVDDCTQTDALTRNRELRATRAAKSVLEAIALPDGGRAGRLARASAALDVIFEQEPGCTIDNNYCDAPELDVTECGCGTGPNGAKASLVPGLLVLAGLLRGRRRSAAIASAITATLLVMAGPARADDPAPTPAPAPDQTEVTPVVVPVTTTTNGGGPEGEAPKSDKVEEKVLDQEDKVIAALPDPTTKKWGFAMAIGGSLQRGAAAASAGLRWNPCECLGFGLDVEYNPYIAFSELDVVPGSVQVYVPIIWKMRKFGSWELRSTFGIGASMLLFDLVEADKGSIGLFANWNPLGVAFSFGANWKLVVKPGDIAVPVPELVGFPFYYPQYRFTVGFEWYP